jgi:signal transduction histidine kinase
MSITPPFRWRAALWITCLLVLLFTLQNYFAPPVVRQSLPLLSVFGLQVITWVTWLLLLPLIVRAVRRFRRRGRRDLLIQVIIAYGVVVLHGLISGLARWSVGLSLSSDLLVVLRTATTVTFALSVTRYCLIAAAVHALTYYQDLRARELRTARLEASLARAQLDNLQGKLQPHFLFNTLNSIAALIREQPRLAEQMVGMVGELLRASLSVSDAPEVSLARELSLLEKYVAIERLRFQDRLTIAIDIPAELQSARVPQFLLQPLVENAIRHGVGPREAPGSVRVTAESDETRLRLRVEDDGIGMQAAWPRNGSGIGLSATRERLRQLYGHRQRLEISPGAEAGTVVTIELPLQREPVMAQ